MATKTISLELDAYEKLKAAKRPGESFSATVRRARFGPSDSTGRTILALLQDLAVEPTDRAAAKYWNADLAAARTTTPSRWRERRMKLVDTDFLIDLQREWASENAGPATAFLHANHGTALAISTVSVLEFLEGYEHPRAGERLLEAYLRLPVTDSVARRGQPPAPGDCAPTAR